MHAIMTSADSARIANVAQDLVRWILDQALDGIGPLPSASDLANDYRRQSYPNDAERVQALIRWAVAKNAATGFVTGLGGVLTLPVAIPGSLAASLAIQAPMVAAIAEIYGHDSKDDQVRTAILLCMIGTAMEDVVKQAGVTLGGKAAIKGLKKIPGKVLIEINKRVGFRLLTKFGEKGVVNLAKARTARRRGGRGHIRRGNLLHGRSSGGCDFSANGRRTTDGTLRRGRGRLTRTGTELI